ncbi:MAG: imidazoleglycerol-phosphate dehydratase HisB [Candidatus Omnitrophica bacterium]|nr:imidazoleglycerol-phosphate dehydratase HisB [Candidatus Omnitrophota bacterium]
MKRTAEIKRKTKETDIIMKLNLDGKGKGKVKTGIGFLDHMLELFAYHGLFDLTIKAKGDLDVDIHHTNEDIGIALGQAFKKALKTKSGISRFGQSFVPMDEALARARVVLDISGRLSLYFKCKVKKLKPAKGYDTNDCEEFLKAFVLNSGINMHVDIIRGKDTHHALESVFKALGRALSEAISIEPRRGKKVPSTKGRL